MPCICGEILNLSLFMLPKMRKKKRLLSVHSFDFETDSEYSSQSRRQSVQLSGKEDFQVLGIWWWSESMVLSSSFSLFSIHCISLVQCIDSCIDRSTEEKELRRKSEELTSSITEKVVSIDEENAGKKTEESKPEMDSSTDDLPPNAKKVLSSVSLSSFQKTLFRQPLCNVTYFPVFFVTSSTKVSICSVSDIESRIAALSAAGLTVKPVERSKKKRGIQVSIPKFYKKKPNDIMSVSHVLRKKFSISHETPSNAESFARNSYYRGSLTQRNPNGRNRKIDHIFTASIQNLLHGFHPD
uniref:Uncharacterized protein n=1 Tax=Pseudonaja textilis TaxID=8673 RepID=A0A670XTC7_PSETE